MRRQLHVEWPHRRATNIAAGFSSLDVMTNKLSRNWQSAFGIVLLLACNPVALSAWVQEENTMSKSCGDTARFNRLRKQKLRTRERIRKLRAAIAAHSAATEAEKPKS